jgi:hypothetical protein
VTDIRELLEAMHSGGTHPSAPQPVPEAVVATLREMSEAYKAVHGSLHQIHPFLRPGDLLIPQRWAGSIILAAIVLDASRMPETQRVATPESFGRAGLGQRVDIRIAGLHGPTFGSWWAESWEWQRVTEEQMIAELERARHESQ